MGGLAQIGHGYRTLVARREPPLWRLVGNTPLLALEPGLLLKAEWLNPGGSVKDRPARQILRAGLAMGALPARRLLDASSGNTAVAYAMLGAAAGTAVTLCVPSNAARSKLELLRVYGAEVVETDPLEGSDGAIRRARELALAAPERYWYADQYGNPSNTRSHELTTGPEIWRATRGRVTHLVAGVGTSGTLVGAGRFLKARRADIRLVAVQPSGPLHGLEGLKHMATAIVPGIYDPALVDETVFVTTEAAEARVRELAKSRGLFVGWSTGAALVAAEQVVSGAVVETGRRPVVVVVAPDGGTAYLSDRRRVLGSHEMRMDRAVLAAIRRHLAAAYPAEGCGFLLGMRSEAGDAIVARQLPVPNRRDADGRSRSRYLIGPDEVRGAEREAAAAGLLVVGAYHSHPDAPARPSRYDEEHAWPWYGYLIVSVVRGVPRDERVYELREDRDGFVERELSLTDAPDVKEA